MATIGEDNEKESAEGAEGQPRAGGVFKILFPPDPMVWNEARKLVSDRNLRVEDLATCSSQDPAIVLDLLKTSNAMFFSGGKSPITSTKTAIVRLGSELITETLEKMKGRDALEEDRVAHWFDIHRSRCRRAAIIARILAEGLARTLSDDCQAAALFSFVGELLAVVQLRETYTRMADEHSRSTVLYRLSQDHRFDCESMGLAYLRRIGIPEALVSALDRDARIRQTDRAIMKPLCAAAAEFIDAFDLGRWEKLAPGKNLPPKSAIRLLGIQENQYLKIYERASEYLNAARVLDEKRKNQPVPSLGSNEEEEDTLNLPVAVEADKNSGLAADIDTLLGDLEEDEDVDLAPRFREEDDEDEDLDEDMDLHELHSDFALNSASNKSEARTRETQLSVPETSLRTNKMETTIHSLGAIFESAKTSEQILTQLLDMLVAQGPFEKSALIVVSKDRKKAVVVAARGPGIENRQIMHLDDPLSPLAKCFSKVQSFGNKGSRNSPFGSRSYALAPIDADHESPVALYADCGQKGSITFEARRIFRLVVQLLNQKLPQVVGGIPVEI